MYKIEDQSSATIIILSILVVGYNSFTKQNTSVLPNMRSNILECKGFKLTSGISSTSCLETPNMLEFVQYEPKSPRLCQQCVKVRDFVKVSQLNFPDQEHVFIHPTY